MKSLVAGKYVFRFAVTNSAGQTGKDSVSVTVKPMPVIIIGLTPHDTTITLPTNSLTLTGKATDAFGSLTSYLWSQVSGPSTASIVNGNSQSATVKGVITGKYLFQFTATDNKGLTGKDTASVTVNPMPGKTTTLTLVPVSNPSEFNVGLLGTTDYSQAASGDMSIYAWTKNNIALTMRNLLKFDLSGIPANATILKADLYLYSDTIPTLYTDSTPKKAGYYYTCSNSGTDNSILVQQIGTSWDPTTLTWFNQPKGLTANQVIVPSTTLPAIDVDINVQAIVSSMVSTNSNYGFILSLKNEIIYTSRIFCSSHYIDPARWPRLVIKYQ